MREFAHTLAVNAPPAAVLQAFFDPDALAAWWRARRSLCVPRPLGSYAVEWEPTEWHDELLGRLGGAFRGTVIEFADDREFFVADLTRDDATHDPGARPPSLDRRAFAPLADGVRHRGRGPYRFRPATQRRVRLLSFGARRRQSSSLWLAGGTSLRRPRRVARRRPLDSRSGKWRDGGV